MSFFLRPCKVVIMLLGLVVVEAWIGMRRGRTYFVAVDFGSASILKLKREDWISSCDQKLKSVNA